MSPVAASSMKRVTAMLALAPTCTAILTRLSTLFLYPGDVHIANSCIHDWETELWVRATLTLAPSCVVIDLSLHTTYSLCTSPSSVVSVLSIAVAFSLERLRMMLTFTYPPSYLLLSHFFCLSHGYVDAICAHMLSCQLWRTPSWYTEISIVDWSLSCSLYSFNKRFPSLPNLSRSLGFLLVCFYW